MLSMPAGHIVDRDKQLETGIRRFFHDDAPRNAQHKECTLHPRVDLKWIASVRPKLLADPNFISFHLNILVQSAPRFPNRKQASWSLRSCKNCVNCGSVG